MAFFVLSAIIITLHELIFAIHFSLCNVTVIDICTAATLARETSQVHNDNFQSYQPQFCTTADAQSKTTSSLSAQLVRVHVQLL